MQHDYLFRLPLCLILLIAPGLGQADWPQFRGPSGDGQVAVKLPIQWQHNSVNWKAAIPGRGYASPVIIGEKVWLTTAVERNATEKERKDLEKTIDPKYAKQRSYLGKVDFKALCFDANSGELIHEVLLVSLTMPEPVHKTNSYASPTPVISEGRLYCHFGAYGTWCLDAYTGKKIWDTKVKVQFSVGPGSSPVIYKNLLILVCDGIDEQFVTALDKVTGQEMWRTNRPPLDKAQSGEHKKSFCTPLVISWQGKDQLISPAAIWLVSYDPMTGKEIWRYEHGKGFSVVPRPVFKDGIIYFSTGFGKAVIHAVNVDGKGNVTKSNQLWTYKRSVSRLSSFVIAGNELFQVDGKGVATCLDLKTGKMHWSQRLEGQYTASPIHADGKLYFSNKSGQTMVVAADKKFKVLQKNQVVGEFHASPAVIGNSLILRTTEGLFRVN